MRCYQATHPVDYAYRVKDISDNRNIFGYRRGAMVRAVCETFLTECIEFEKTSTVRPLLFLSQRGHKAWFLRELLYTEEEAESKWHRDFADKTVRRKHEEDVLKLAVVGHTQEIREVGKITQSSTGPEAFQATSSKRALHAVVDKDNRRPRNPRGSSEDESPSPPRHKWPTRKRSRRSNPSASASRGRSRRRQTRSASCRSRGKRRTASSWASTTQYQPSVCSPSVASRSKPDEDAATRLKNKSKTDDEEQIPSRRGGGSEALVKVDAENMIDEKLSLDTKAQQDIDKLMKTVVELQKNIAKVIEDEEDKQKVDQLDIEDSIAKAQRLRDEMGESLKSARNAKLAGFLAARDVVVKKQAEATQLLGTLASSVKACKNLVAARNDKDKHGQRQGGLRRGQEGEALPEPRMWSASGTVGVRSVVLRRADGEGASR